MSLELLRAVIYYSRAKGTAYAVAIGLADHYNDERGSAWPSVPRLATFARASERATQNALKDLCTPQAQGGLGEWRCIQRNGKPNLYVPNFNNFGPRIVPSPRGAESAGVANPWGADFSGGDQTGVQNLRGRGAESAPNPVIEPKEPVRAQKAPEGNREQDESTPAEDALEQIRALRKEL